MVRILISLIFISFLPACVAPKAQSGKINGSAQIEFARGQSLGFVDIDDGDYDSKTKLNLKDSKAAKMTGRLNKLLGDGFDPNAIKAPNYDKAKYKSKISKELLLDELITNAYDAYKEISGKKWYPKKVPKGIQSQDPLLRKDRWLLKADDRLHDVLLAWGRRANWKVVWRADYEYPVQVGALFKGSFTKAISDLLGDFDNRTPRLYATFYKNRVVVFRNEELE